MGIAWRLDDSLTWMAWISVETSDIFVTKKIAVMLRFLLFHPHEPRNSGATTIRDSQAQ